MGGPGSGRKKGSGGKSKSARRARSSQAKTAKTFPANAKIRGSSKDSSYGSPGGGKAYFTQNADNGKRKK